MRQTNPEYFKADIDIHKVKRVEFGILNPNEIAKMSVVKVDNRLVYGPNGEPNKGGTFQPPLFSVGLNDLAMGSTSGRDICMTCRGSTHLPSSFIESNECPGHFGHIELAKPMFHVGFIDKVLRLLRCVCYKCSKLLCDEASAGRLSPLIV
jgi:DNA-directed RNA polymerase II subunit RPB1